jgi:nicotinamidase/pyrazinamidase
LSRNNFNLNKQTMSNKALLVIDAQNDFHDIPSATLPVPGACADTQRIADFIAKQNPQTIFASLDSHYSLDISHPSWWENADGSLVSPFTMITSADIKNGKYVPRIDPKRSLSYVEALEANGEFSHFIWPEHCLIGTPGHALHPVFFEACKGWMTKNLRWVNFINKGVNPYTEHFGIFRANVPLNEDPSTQVNQSIFAALNTHDEIYLAGQARSHCVATSLRQMLQIAPNLATKLIVLEDCMSDVQGLPSDFYDYVNGIYSDAEKAGVRIVKSTNL